MGSQGFDILNGLRAIELLSSFAETSCLEPLPIQIKRLYLEIRGVVDFDATQDIVYEVDQQRILESDLKVGGQSCCILDRLPHQIESAHTVRLVDLDCQRWLASLGEEAFDFWRACIMRQRHNVRASRA